MAQWKTLSRTPVVSFGKWLAVEDHTVETPDGKVIEGWPWVKTPDYINVLAVTGDGKFLVFRQGKYGIDGESLAPVGGYIEQGEEPMQAAIRELREETGYEASEWVPLGQFLVDPNRGVATGFLFLAKGAYRVSEPIADDLEELHLLLVDRSELEAGLQAGQFKVLAWAANIALALMRI